MCRVTGYGPFAKLTYECQLALQEELGAQAAEKQQAMCGLQEQVDCLQDQVAQAQNACSPAQVRTRLPCVYMYIDIHYKAVSSG